jgi:signal transduction histidine kinase/CheY-like chemotaxis protein
VSVGLRGRERGTHSRPEERPRSIGYYRARRFARVFVHGTARVNLQAKTTALLTAITAVVLTIATGVSLHVQEASLESSILSGLAAQAQTAAWGISAFLDESLHEAQAVASTLPPVGPTSQQALEAHLEQMSRAFPRFGNGIFLLDRDGRFLADYPSHPELRGHSFAYREYFLRAVREKRAIVGKAYRSKRTGKPVLTFASPVLDARGDVSAVVACSVDLLSREALGGYRNQRLGETGYLYVFDRQRRLLLHPNDERLLTFVVQGKNRLLEAALDGGNVVGPTVNSQGVPMLLAVSHLPNSEWILGAQIPQREAFRPIAVARLRLYAISAVAVLLVMAGSAVALRRVVRPLRQLERAASRTSAGLQALEAGAVNLEVDDSLETLRRIRSRDEIGLLASAFVGLSEKLTRYVADSKKAEAERLRAQKLESLGVLAGGIAHDFNNILTAILGNLSIARQARPGDDLAEVLRDAEKAALSAKGLTHQLLTFSRGGAPIRKVVSLQDVLREAARFALRGAKARAEFSIPADLWTASVDEDQIRQVVHNLVLNADQAMPEGGVLALIARNFELAEGEGIPLRAGQYVSIAIRDTGVGLSPEHLDRVFDPYFTTKRSGNGLGLTSSYAIVKKHDGHLAVESKLGRGTTFTVYLPASQERVARPEVEGATALGSGRVLVMDDEEVVRAAAGRMLARLGYEVELARDGDEALRAYTAASAGGRPFDVVVMDLTIPGGVGGEEAMRRLAALDPQARGIVSSGYSTDPVMADFRAHGFCCVLRKPYSIEDLGRAVAEAVAPRAE